MFSLSYLPTAERLTVVIVKARKLKLNEDDSNKMPQTVFVKVSVTNILYTRATRARARAHAQIARLYSSRNMNKNRMLLPYTFLCAPYRFTCRRMIKRYQKRRPA